MCGIWERFRRHYHPITHHGEVKLDLDDVDRTCQRVVDHGLDTQLVADQFDISRRRVQQLAKQDRDTDEIPELETPGRNHYADYPDDLHVRILELYERSEQGATAIAKLLRIRDGITVDNNTVHAILQESEHVTENPSKQGRKRPWVRWEREFLLVTVSMDWFQNSREHWVLGVEDNASRKVLRMVETDARSAEQSVDLLEEVLREYAPRGEILEVITDHGSEFNAPNRDEDGEASHPFEEYLDAHGIKQRLRAVSRPQSNGMIERFFQTDDKQRWRFDSLDEFLKFYNDDRPHMSPDWDQLETPNQALERLLPTTEVAAAMAVADGGDDATK